MTAATPRVTTFLLWLSSGLVYPVIGFYVAQKLIYEGLHNANTNGADDSAIVIGFALPITASMATAAIARRRWQACLGFGFLSALGVLAVSIAFLAALVHSGVLE